jgi:tripartite-type tricarboxylate transporter receptor subunit TctC
MITIARLFVVFLWIVGASAAHAQTEDAGRYPAKGVKIIVPFPPGGPASVFARLLADRLQSTFDQPFIVENRAGATGIIGTSAVANAAPDGYTLLFASNSSQVMAPLLRSPPPYDPLKNFRPISMLMSYPLYLVVNNDVPARTVAELVALAKAQPGKLNFATIGPGSGNHLVTEMFKARAGIDVVHVPHKGVAAQQMAVMAGEVQFMFDSIGPTKPLVDAGKMRALAVTGRARSWASPDTPTLEESGFRGFDAVIWFGIFAPAGTPDPVVGKLEKEIMAFARLPEIEQRIKGYAATMVGSTGAELAQEIAREQRMWADIIKANDIRLGN